VEPTRLVVGRSNIVGKPNCRAADRGLMPPVTICHSKTKDLPGVIGTADILVAAIGKAEMIRGAWIKPGATVISTWE